MATEKRSRQKANRQAKFDDVAKLSQREVIRQRVLLFLVLGVLAGGAIYLFSQVGGDDEAAVGLAVERSDVISNSEGGAAAADDGGGRARSTHRPLELAACCADPI